MNGPVSQAEIIQALAKYPAAMGPPLAARLVRYCLIALAAAYLLYLGVKLELLSEKFLGGLGQTGAIVGQMWPPRPHDLDSAWAIGGRLVETVAMAFLGTVLGAALALPLGFIGAKTVVRQGALHFFIRRGFDAVRGMPVLVWALVFTRAIGLGPMTGVLALATADFAALSKLYAEAIENSDDKQREGVRAAGLGPVAALRFGLVPQVLPVMLSQALYFFEANVRSAAILGIVGAGGIGTILAEAIQFNLWHEVAFIVLLFLVTVSLIDTGSHWLRQRLIGRQKK